jgi:hypothetical protein
LKRALTSLDGFGRFRRRACAHVEADGTDQRRDKARSEVMREVIEATLVSIDGVIGDRPPVVNLSCDRELSMALSRVRA